MTARAALALKVAALLAVDQFGLGGAILRGPLTPARDAWLAALRAQLPSEAPWRKMPSGIGDGRLLGGLDLAATLAAGRPVAERGLLAEASGGVLLVPSAERLSPSAAAHLAAALDTGDIALERDGLAARPPARFAAILLDEGLDGPDGERAPVALAERLAFHLNLSSLRSLDAEVMNAEDMGAEVMGAEVMPNAAAIRDARARLGAIEVSDAAAQALCAAGLALGVPSMRVASFAVRAAKAAAALAGRDHVDEEDVELAAALVIAPRATRLPAQESAEDHAAEKDAPEEQPPDDSPADQLEPSSEEMSAQTPDEETAGSLADSVIEAARAAIPADLLALLSQAAKPLARGAAPGGKGGAAQASARRGRPIGTRRGMPGNGVRLALVDTLRAAAPWQRLRRQAAPALAPGRILVRREDFRVARFKETSETVTIFVVDASGSAALNRLAEVKGAVELILADCYVRRDSVALIAFRGAGAEIILPPTRSLARAKRALAGQAGGGGTPLAAAVDAAAGLADVTRRKGQLPLVVLLTDGRGNIARDGRPGRAQAEADAMAAAQAFRLGGVAALLLDIAPRPADGARRLAAAMGARYIPLPYADAQTVSRAVMAAGTTVSRGNV